MPKISANGLELYYEDLGDPAGEPMLLIAGLGTQCIFWEEGLCRLLGDHGFRVVRFDNRDMGLSTWLTRLGPPRVGPDGLPEAYYTIADMATDAAALLRALGMAPAHVAGQSMGGFIAQQLTIDHPRQVRSLASLSSTTGRPGVGQPTEEAFEALFAPRPLDREGAIAASVAASLVWSSPAYPRSSTEMAARAGFSYDRASHPQGALRQTGAVVHQQDRTEALGAVTVPTLVVHGTADTLVQPSGGRATAAAVPRSRLVLFDGMGHELPEALWPDVARAMADNARRAPGEP